MSHTNLYCHLCAVEQPKFRFTSDNSSNKTRLHEYILRYLPIKITIMKNICMDCANVIQNFHTFVKKVEKAQLKFRNSVVNDTVTIEAKPPEFNDEEISLDSFHDDSKESRFDEEMQFLCETNVNSNSIKVEQVIKLENDFADSDLESNSVGCKQEIDSENQFPDNLANILLDSNDKTTESIENTSLENNLIVNELNKEKLERPGRQQIFNKDRLWVCYRCKKRYIKVESLHKHYESEHNAPVEYMCYKCQILFSDVNAYKRHLLDEHGFDLAAVKTQQFKCKLCSSVCSTAANFRRHQLSHTGMKKFKCNICGKRFGSTQTLRCHSVIHDKGLTNSNMKDELPKLDPSLLADLFKCFACDQTFNLSDDLEEHMKEAHKEVLAKYNCPRCDKSVMSKDVLDEHLKHDHKRYKCRICGKEIGNIRSFMKHHYMHKGRKRFSCDVCDKSFSRSQQLKIHRLQHKRPIFNCDQCEKTFSSQVLFENHQKTHERQQYKRKHGERKYYECDICQKKFVNKYYIPEHKKVMHEENFVTPYVCTKCGKSFKQKGPLLVHETTHFTVNTYHCDKCPKVLKNKYNLKKHKLLHDTIKPFKCNICGMEFKLRSSLTRHGRVHAPEKPFECEICNKNFRERGTLRVHLRQHTGERPYACLECNHYFANDSNFKKHLRGRHGLQNFSLVNNHQYPFINQKND